MPSSPPHWRRRRTSSALPSDLGGLPCRRHRCRAVGGRAFDVSAGERERAAALPGDDIVPDADVVMDRGFTLRAAPEDVRPWFVQLGKKRAGWYLPRAIERVVPPGRRALRRIESGLQALAVGDVIPDWGGSAATFEVATLDRASTIVYRSRRGRTNVSWALVLSPEAGGRTRVHLRLRLSPRSAAAWWTG